MSSTGGVEASRGVGVRAVRLLYFLFGLSSLAGVAGALNLLAVDFLLVSVVGGAGEYRFAADSRRSRAGRTRFAGVTSAIFVR